jgi:hypothetical protein
VKLRTQGKVNHVGCHIAHSYRSFTPALALALPVPPAEPSRTFGALNSKLGSYALLIAVLAQLACVCLRAVNCSNPDFCWAGVRLLCSAAWLLS